MTEPTPIIHKPLPVQTPDWVKRAVFYQIFPDRFAPSERVQHPRGIQFKAWGSTPPNKASKAAISTELPKSSTICRNWE